jgi:hypothetical protein
MKISTIDKPKFDPEARLRDGSHWNIILYAEDLFAIEKDLGRHTSPVELKKVLIGVFTGSYKLVKR